MRYLSNRFAIIDFRNQQEEILKEVLARRIGDIDQALFLDKAQKGGDLRMEIYNHDGRMVESCGNGIRCVAWLEMKARGNDRIKIETLGGLVKCRGKGKLIEADLGTPKLNWSEIPLSREEKDTSHIFIDKISEKLGAGVGVNVGNPHIVFFPERNKLLDIEQIGKFLEHHPLFPQGVNVSLAKIDPLGLQVEVWERGAGATGACGTAACASLIAACRRFPRMPRSSPVCFPEGALEIEWRKSDNHILMRGEATWEREEKINV